MVGKHSLDEDKLFRCFQYCPSDLNRDCPSSPAQLKRQVLLDGVKVDTVPSATSTLVLSTVERSTASLAAVSGPKGTLPAPPGHVETHPDTQKSRFKDFRASSGFCCGANRDRLWQRIVLVGEVVDGQVGFPTAHARACLAKAAGCTLIMCPFLFSLPSSPFPTPFPSPTYSLFVLRSAFAISQRTFVPFVIDSFDRFSILGRISLCFRLGFITQTARGLGQHALTP